MLAESRRAGLFAMEALGIPRFSTRVLPVLPALGLLLMLAAAEADRVPHTAWIALALAVVCVLRNTHPAGVAPSRVPFVLMMLFCAYISFQMIPLPAGLIHWLEPNYPIPPGARFGKLSLAPDASLSHLIRVASYCAVYLLVREKIAELGHQAWLAVIPVLGVASLETTVGLGQLAAGGSLIQATGTFRDHSHFACFLAMALPLAAGYAGTKFNSSSRHPLPLALLTGLCLTLFAGIVAAGSRMAFVSSFLSLVLFTVLALHSKLAKAGVAKLIAVGAMVFIVFALALISSAQIIPRFLKLFTPETARFELPFGIWAQTLAVVNAYPLFGCGLGALGEGVRMLHPSGVTYYAQNDYLQLLAELGLVGGALAASTVIYILWQNFRAIYGARDPRLRWLALAAFCSLTSLLIHCVVEFNLYIPANAMLFAWIAGIPAGLKRHSKLTVLPPALNSAGGRGRVHF